MFYVLICNHLVKLYKFLDKKLGMAPTRYCTVEPICWTIKSKVYVRKFLRPHRGYWMNSVCVCGISCNWRSNCPQQLFVWISPHTALLHSVCKPRKQQLLFDSHSHFRGFRAWKWHVPEWNKNEVLIHTKLRHNFPVYMATIKFLLEISSGPFWSDSVTVGINIVFVARALTPRRRRKKRQSTNHCSTDKFNLSSS